MDLRETIVESVESMIADKRIFWPFKSTFYEWMAVMKRNGEHGDHICLQIARYL